MSVSFETHRHEDKFWNLGPMPRMTWEFSNFVFKFKTFEIRCACNNQIELLVEGLCFLNSDLSLACV